MFSTFHTQPQFHASPSTTRCCAHGRIIDDVLTPQGLKTRKVRCLECSTVLDDPALNNETHGESERELHRQLGGVPTPIYMDSVDQASGRPGSTEIQQAAEQ